VRAEDEAVRSLTMFYTGIRPNTSAQYRNSWKKLAVPCKRFNLQNPDTFGIS